MKKCLLWISILCVLFFSCNLFKKHNQQNVQTDKSITKQTSFNNLFIDSNKINSFIASYPQYKKFQKQYSDFYKQRNYESAWFDSSGITEQAYNFMNLLNNAVNTYNDSSLYSKALTSKVDAFKKDTADTIITATPDITQTELMLTGQFFSYASKIYAGSDINVQELGWFIPRKKLDLSTMLDSLIAHKSNVKNGDFPVSAAYKKLLDFLPVYNKLNQQENWDTIAYPSKALHKKSSSEIIPAIKQKLYALGDLITQDTTDVFDSSLFVAVKNFEVRMGQIPDGVIGKSFIKQLNVSPAQRLQQILINLERLRWLPERNDSSTIIVNIPEYKMYVYNNGQLQFDMDVVVGASATGTVIFTGNLKYIVFSPYWNIPVSIIKKEILPGIQRNKNYLAEHRMEIYGKNSGGLPAIRQLPGPDNALGRVKFLFPNNFDIYFHDTNNHGAFNSSKRSLSHGCIRLSEPKKLAEYLLQSDTVKYSSHNIDSLMNLPKEKWVTLKNPVPVMISYYTAFVDKNGKLNFRPDIYKHDSAMAVKLFAPNSIAKK
jgi:murein L,D-transpeptidase YcbB/YkuD